MTDLEKERQAYEAKHSTDPTFKQIVAPDIETRKLLRKKIDDSTYFILITLVSLLSVIIPPLFSGCLLGDISIVFPKTIEGWILWLLLKCSSVAANISLLVLFKMQAKKNSKTHPNYIKANEILNLLYGTDMIFNARSPEQMNKEDYRHKVVSIVITTITSSIVLTSLILSFDWMTLLSCLLSGVITLCISWITLLKNEEYWCDEFLMFAIKCYNKEHLEEPLIYNDVVYKGKVL